MIFDQKPPQSPINIKAGQTRGLNFQASSGLAAGLKRVGGRSGVSRLGRLAAGARRGRPIILHKY